MSYLYFSHEITTKRMPGVHAHSRHEFYYLAKGKTKYLIGDEIYTVEEGNAVFIPKGIYHMTDNGGCSSVERYLLSFDENTFDCDTKPILDELFSCRLISIPMNRKEGLEAMFASLERALNGEGALTEAFKKVHVLSILSYVCRHKRRYEPSVSEADKIVHDISEYVTTHYSEDISLPQLSFKFSVSESHLSRKFKDVSGVGLNEYITLVRIMNAERLLREGGRTITEISALCGFNDPNYFSAVFKKIKGVTPLKFSKTAEQDR